MSANWGTAGPQGDVNGDGIVNIFDINLISSQWGATGATAVPEPTTLILAFSGLLGGAYVRRARRTKRSLGAARYVPCRCGFRGGQVLGQSFVRLPLTYCIELDS